MLLVVVWKYYYGPYMYSLFTYGLLVDAQTLYLSWYHGFLQLLNIHDQGSLAAVAFSKHIVH